MGQGALTHSTFVGIRPTEHFTPVLGFIVVGLVVTDFPAVGFAPAGLAVVASVVVAWVEAGAALATV